MGAGPSAIRAAAARNGLVDLDLFAGANFRELRHGEVRRMPSCDRPGGRYLLPLPFVQLWRHVPSNNVAALPIRTQRLLVCR